MNRIESSPASALHAKSPSIADVRMALDGGATLDTTAARVPLQAMLELGGPLMLERSFRLSPGTLLAERFLLSVDVKTLACEPLNAVARLCERMQAPAACVAEIIAEAPRAACFHAGYEQGAGSPVYKIYVESRVPNDHPPSGSQVPLFHAVKWRPREQNWVSTRYLWRVGMSPPAIVRAVRESLGDAASPVADAAVDLLMMAAKRLPAISRRFMDVVEPGTGRSSFDINLYDAKLRVLHARDVLERMCKTFDISSPEFQGVYDRAATEQLGHLAGGVHRGGEPFVTFYHGAQAREFLSVEGNDDRPGQA